MNDENTEYFEPKYLENFTLEELENFSEQYACLVSGIEEYINSPDNKMLRDYITADAFDGKGGYYPSFSITAISDSTIDIALYRGSHCNCCRDETSETSILISWIFDDAWKPTVEKKEQERLAKEQKKTKENQEREEASDRRQLERLQKKFSEVLS